jgi:hypothetical protein
VISSLRESTVSSRVLFLVSTSRIDSFKDFIFASCWPVIVYNQAMYCRNHTTKSLKTRQIHRFVQRFFFASCWPQYSDYPNTRQVLDFENGWCVSESGMVW